MAGIEAMYGIKQFAVIVQLCFLSEQGYCSGFIKVGAVFGS